MRNQTPEEKLTVTLRVNRDLLEEIRKIAQHDSRSINSYLNNLMRQQVNAFMTPANTKRK